MKWIQIYFTQNEVYFTNISHARNVCLQIYGSAKRGNRGFPYQILAPNYGLYIGLIIIMIRCKNTKSNYKF